MISGGKRKHRNQSIISRLFNPKSIIMKEKIIYHGGCHSCESQSKYGLKRCEGCQFHKANWSLPNLSTDTTDQVEQLIEDYERIIEELEKAIKATRFNYGPEDLDIIKFSVQADCYRTIVTELKRILQ